MLERLSDHIRICLERAAAARGRADEAGDPCAKADLLRLEASWELLAQSYQFAERLERFLREGNTRALGWQPASIAPFDRDLELAVISGDGPHALVFPCRRILGGWVKAETRGRIELRPTHWREWPRTP